MMDILMSETCWAPKKWNKIASDIKLVFYSSTITMMHGAINIIFSRVYTNSAFLGVCAKLRKATTDFVICVCLSGSQWTDFSWNSLFDYFSKICLENSSFINPLAPELLFFILAHSVYKMWIKQEPNTLELWTKLHFEEEKTESIYRV